MHTFDIQYRSPLPVTEYTGVRIDPLGELEPDERGLQQYCLEKNCRIAIVIDDQEVLCQLFPDIANNIPYFGQLLADVHNGEAASISLSERHVEITLEPIDDHVSCEILRFGEGTTRRCAPRKLVVHSIASFMKTLYELAYSEGYLTNVDYARLSETLACYLNMRMTE